MRGFFITKNIYEEFYHVIVIRKPDSNVHQFAEEIIKIFIEAEKAYLEIANRPPLHINLCGGFFLPKFVGDTVGEIKKGFNLKG